LFSLLFLTLRSLLQKLQNMKLEGLVAVSGLSGLFKMIANRSNGLIVEDLASGKRRFASVRQHQFTPLESIGINTDDGESVELKVVFSSILEKLEATPIVEVNAPNRDLQQYFNEILPNYDRDRVHIGDMKKVIKWFTFLNERGLLAATEAEEEASNMNASEEE